MKQTKDNIILIGMPYSGKTTTAKLLSEKLGFKFIDLDILIEENEGLKISEIFSKFGEEYFRKLETKTLKNIIEDKPFILSTGGGTAQKDENLEILKQMGKIFYLEIMPNKIFDRIKDDKTRPLLQKNNPKKVLEDLYNIRRQNYEKANFKINAENGPQEVVNEIIKKYE